jgi:Zn-finger nucleic acid-binding protein
VPICCPKCPSAELQRPRSGTDVVRCYTCGGMWVSEAQAERLAIQGGDIADPQSLRPTANPRDDRTGLCPSGHGVLLRTSFQVEADTVYLEKCRECAGMWFDLGDWEKLRRHHLLDNLRDLWDPTWQRQLRQKQAEEKHRARLAEAIGEEELLILEQVAKGLRHHPMRSEVIAYFYDQSEARERVRITDSSRTEVLSQNLPT